MNSDKLHALMDENPRLTSRQYAELAVKNGLAEDIDPNELMLREVQKDVRRIVRESKSDPEFAFVSVTEDRTGGGAEPVYIPAKACTAKEAQRVLDDYASDVDGLMTRAMRLKDYWNSDPFQYQLTFNIG